MRILMYRAIPTPAACFVYCSRCGINADQPQHYPCLSCFLCYPVRCRIPWRMRLMPPAKSLQNQLSIEHTSVRKRHISQ